MPNYILNGEVVEVAPEHVEIFKAQNPSSKTDGNSNTRIAKDILPTPGKLTGPAIAKPIVGSENTDLDLKNGSSGYDGPETVGELAYDIIGFDFAEPFVEKAKAAVEFFGHIMDDYEYQTEETDTKKGQYENIKKAMAAAGFSGKYNPLVNLFAEGLSNMGRSGEGGSAQGAGTEAGFIVMNAAVDTDSDEELLQKAQGLIDVNNNNQGKEPTDNIKKYQERYDQLEEEHGGTMAWMVAVAENPMYIRDVSIQSLAMMGTALATSETIQRNAAVGTTGAAMAGSFIPGIGTGLAAISGLFGSISGQMDASLSYQQFLQEQLTEDGKDFTAENIVDLLQDDKIETYEDPNGNTMLDITGTKADIVKQRSIRRGWAVGLTDGFTGILSGGVAKGSLLKSSKLTTKTTKAIKGTATAVTGGLASEIGGQTAGGQEYDAGEILTEGFAEKGMVMTGITVIPQLIKKKGSYILNGEKLTEKKFVKEVNNMNDVTLAQASYKIENDGAMQNQLGLRVQNAVMESQIDAKVSDSKDRKTLVEKQKQLEKAEADKKKDGTAYAVPGAKAKVEKIKAEMEAIIDKYAGTDGRKKTVRDRAKIKELVARAQERILLEETEKFAESGGKKLDLNPYQAFINTDKFVKGVVDHLMRQKQYIFDGVEVDITKLSDKKIAEEVQRIEKSSRDGAGAAILTDTNGKDTIFINREAAVRLRQFNVGSHEILHKVLKGALTNMKPEAREILINEFKQEVEANLGGKALKLIEKQLDAYGSTINRKTSSEWFTALSDVIESKENNITYDNSKSFFDSIKDMIPDVFKKETEYKNLSIKNGAQAFEFMKEYSQNVKKGELSERMVAFAKGQKIPPKDKKAGVEFSKDSKGPIDAVNKIEQGLKDRLKTSKEEYTKEQFLYSEEFDTIFRSIKDGSGAINNYILSLGLGRDKTQKVIQYASDRLRNYNPQKERKSDSKEAITVGERIMSDIMYAKLDADKSLAIKSKTESKTLRIDAARRTQEGESTFDLEDTSVDAEMKAFEEEDMSPAAQAKKKADKAKGKQVKESEFRNKVGFKTGSKIYNEILDIAKKTLIRAYGKTLNIKDVAVRERAVVLEIQKEHNSLNSPLFKQIKNWLSYGLPQEVVPQGTKDIYFSNLKEFREDITRLISTADLVQVERMISEIDRIFTVYKETLTRKADVEKAVDNLELPPDAIRKYEKDKKVSVYDKVIPSETQIVAFAAQPLKIPAKDKSGNIMRDDKGNVLMVRSGLKGTRKDGIAKNTVNGLIFDAVMEARQSKEVQDRLKQLDVGVTSVQELSAATGRPTNLKFSKNIAKGNISAFAQEAINNKKNIYPNFGKEDRQRRKTVTSLGEILKATKNDPVLTAMFTHMKDKVSEGLSFGRYNK